MAWFRRDNEPPPAPAAPDPGDSPAALRRNAYELNRFINANAGRLPIEAVVDARRVTDMLREVIDTSQVRELDVYAVITVKGVLEDYLPTTLRTYLALPAEVTDVPGPGGQSPAQAVITQVDSLYAAATELLTAVRAQDADALAAQGAFLNTKFTKSDLDL